ncbi:MAG TPA: MASE1 domain-containing protein [Rhodanobacter sp.]|nr:MASE1 domain-containing protein [Rhodanobacter sp.]
MQKGIRGGVWLRHAAVAVFYCLLVTAVRHISFSHWLILSGLYLSVLLLSSYRYWPALMLGEIASLAHLSYTCSDRFGATWGLYNLVPSLLLIAPVVWWARERGGIFAKPRGVNIGTLLLSALGVAFIITIRAIGAMMITKLPAGYPTIDFESLAARWVLGNYLGVLTITPLVLLLHQEIVHSSWTDLKSRFAHSRLVRDVAFSLLPVLAGLVWVGLSTAPGTQIRQVAQIAMFLPIVWLALRHGWHGAAVGGAAASLAILALMPHRYDHDTIQAEIVVAFVISTMLLMGARIAMLDGRVRNEQSEMRLALSLAQRNTELGETQLRMTSQTLEQIGLLVHSVCSVLTNRQQQPYAVSDDRSYHHLAMNAKDQLFGLADSLYPVGWEEKGLSSALREGQIPRALDKAGIRYWCDLRGPLNQLSSALQLAIYRLVCDAIADTCSRKRAAAFSVRLRCGEYRGRLWVVLRLGSKADQARSAGIPWDQLMQHILPAGSGRGFPSILDRATTFEGYARERSLPDGRRVSVLLFDPQRTENEKPSGAKPH